MAANLQKLRLLEIAIRAVKDCGWNVLHVGGIKKHPFRLRVFLNDEGYTVRIYIWNLTHGGGAKRPGNEYRIQITGIDGFKPEPGGKTLILGWWEQIGVFAGFDFNRHSGSLGASPSIQIREEHLRNAHVNSGFSICKKGNKEIAVAFHPLFFTEYVRNLESLHGLGVSQRALEIINRIPGQILGSTDIPDEIMTEPIGSARRKVVASIRKTLRDANFRTRVLTAYNHRCAFCGLQLDLVDAAHILPVSCPESTDQTSNGLALCALHHRAFDNSLGTVDSKYAIRIKDDEISRLKNVRHADGLENFLNNLRPLIILPPSIEDRPRRRFLEEANRTRGWFG